MRIAISVDTNQDMESIVAHHFGRCPYFAFIDLDGDDVISLNIKENPYHYAHQPGQVPSYIKDQNTNIMLSGGMGRRAIQFFDEYGIEARTGAKGTVRDTLESFLAGELNQPMPCEDSHQHKHD